MALSPGEKLGPYEILARIGKGGMGEVWKAHDPRLNRDVAIKVSAAQFSERFEREAKAIAALNHPHICSLYDVGPDFLVMEHVDGTPLQGPLPLDQALFYASQICDALEAAHRKGIIHRDLKPGNILVGENGVKVLDFGLAKIERAPSPDGATETVPLTSEGSFMGTLPYMAPEQIEGKEADARADIFAFGVVLYELISGKRPFAGSSQPSLIASILKEQPRPLRELQPLASHGLARVIQTCLEKEPDKRWQSAREVKHALAWVSQGALDAAQSTEAPANNLRLWQGIAALMTLIALGLAGWMFWPKTEPAPEVFRYRLPLPANTVYIDTALGRVSGDGRKLAFTASSNGVPRVWVQNLNSLEEARPLAGTEGSVFPIFWSFDNRWVMFQLNGKLMKVDVAGGAPVTLCDLKGQVSVGGAENAAGRILLGTGGEAIWEVPSAGGVATPVTKLDRSRGEHANNQPAFLPDGRHFLYFRRSDSADNTGTYIGDLEATPEQQSTQRLIAGSTAGQYAPPRGPHPGFVLFHRDGNLFAQPFDERSLKLASDPVRIADQVGTFVDGGLFSVSNTGALMYRSSSDTPYQLTWFDRQGKRAGLAGRATPLQFGPAISPQGTQALVSRPSGPRSVDLWRIDLEKNTETQLTTDAAFGGNSVWSPDGNQIAFSTSRGGHLDLYRKAADGASDEALLLESAEDKVPYSWSRDGRFLLYNVLDPKTGPDIWVLPVDDPKKGMRLLGTPAAERYPQFSPNMRWMAYSSDESGRVEQVFVRELLLERGSNSFRLGPVQIVSRNGGSMPAWRGDGKELFYQTSDGTIMAAAMANGERPTGPLEPGEPATLFQQSALLHLGWLNWAVTRDGQRFLFVARAPSEVQKPFTMVVNWQAGLK